MGFVAGQEQWWQEAQQFLSQPAETAFQRICSRICSLTSIDSGPEDPTILLDHEREQLHRILDAPSHPELLGRIGRYELEQLVGRGGMGLVLEPMIRSFIESWRSRP